MSLPLGVDNRVISSAQEGSGEPRWPAWIRKVIQNEETGTTGRSRGDSNE